MTELAPYGTWKSPISAADVAGGAVGVSYPCFAGGEVWWQERRPSEAGRTAIVAAAGAQAPPRELLPAPWNARNRVHEYGGRSYLPVPSLSLAGGFDLVFANFADQRLYAASGSVELPRGGTGEGGAGEGGTDAAGAGFAPDPLTPADGGFRFADLVLSPDETEVWCVRETVRPLGADGAPPAGFHVGGGLAVRREIVAVPLDGSAAADPAAIRVLVSGAQFFACPTPSPDGATLAWISWNHPNMPWDGTELRVGPVPAGPGGGPTAGPLDVARAALVMGGPQESVLAPRWRDDSTLYVISDASGWWNLYEVAAAAGAPPRPLHPLEQEFAGPSWELGGRPFELLADGRLVVQHGLGEFRLGLLDAASGELTDFDLPGYRTTNGDLAVSGSATVTVAGGPRAPWSVLRVTAAGDVAQMKQAADAADPAYLPDARPVQLSGGPNGGVVHAIVYAPANPAATAPDGELPPFVVHVHGGPTSNSFPVLSMEKAYFTSRGIGIVDVNYGGSTGYGRAYRNRLRGQWGIVDVADAYAAALGLAAASEADRARLGIRGGSAGGWTALAAVTSGPLLAGTGLAGTGLAGTGLAGAGEAVFAAATSYFGVSDLRPFVTDTHDFESRYLDGLIGPLPEADALYTERAPVGHVTELTCPILLLQGLDDPIVPPSQSEAIAADLAAHGIRHAYIAFAGESHGFRKAESLTAALEAELGFYGAVFGFTPPGVPPLELS
jgi:dipeptidyl aminopeptidase/acylaminoacyl peptidase